MNRVWINAAGRLLITWLVLSVFVIVFHRWLVSGLIPFLSTILQWLGLDYRPTLELVHHQGQDMLQLSALLTEPRLLSNTQVMPAGTVVKSGGSHTLHVLVPLVILWSVLWAWPVKGYWQRFALLGLGVPMTWLLSGLVEIPFQTGKIEMYLHTQALQAGADAPQPWLVTWMIFLESGGRWLLALVAAGVCVTLIQRLGRKLPSRHSEK